MFTIYLVIITITADEFSGILSSGFFRKIASLTCAIGWESVNECLSKMAVLKYRTLYDSESSCLSQFAGAADSSILYSQLNTASCRTPPAVWLHRSFCLLQSADGSYTSFRREHAELSSEDTFEPSLSVFTQTFLFRYPYPHLLNWYAMNTAEGI